MEFDRIDHLVLYVADIEATVAFYERLGAEAVTFGDGRQALQFGGCKINLHPAGDPYWLHAAAPESGAGDFCIVVETPLSAVVDRLEREGIEIVEGPIDQEGARGEMRSVYVRDPDGNLVEFAEYVDG